MASAVVGGARGDSAGDVKLLTERAKKAAQELEELFTRDAKKPDAA